MPSPIMRLVIQNLTIRFSNLTAVDNVSAVPKEGGVTAIVGRNASGKSTLLRACFGAIRPTRGVVMVDGRLPIHRMSPRRLAREIAFVAQRPRVAADFDVRSVVELGRYALLPDAKRIDDVMERLELLKHAERPFAHLSVGQQQRVMLARALAQLPERGLLLLDEPTSAMDLHWVHLCHAVLQERAERGATVLIAMHDLSAAASLADEAWLLERGELIEAGDVEEVLDPQRLESLYGLPFEWIETSSGKRVLHASNAAI